MPVMPENLCDVCLSLGLKACGPREDKERLLVLQQSISDLSVTPTPLGGNDKLAKNLHARIKADLARLRAVAEERGCTIFLGPPSPQPPSA